MKPMIFKDILNHFEIDGEFPEYLLSQTLNKVFLDGDLTMEGDTYKIEITTRQNVTHQLFINPNEEFPLIVMSELPNGSLNGMKFGQRSSDVKYINSL